MALVLGTLALGCAWIWLLSIALSVQSSEPALAALVGNSTKLSGGVLVAFTLPLAAAAAHSALFGWFCARGPSFWKIVKTEGV